MASILSILVVLVVSTTTPLLISAAVQPCNSFEQQALLAIPAHLGRTPYFSSWTPTTSCCGGTWKGVECTDGRVTSLTIVDTNVTGQIPLGIFDLRFLRSLTLKHLPNLYGRLHHQFNLLTNMTYLTISHTGVSYPLTSGVLDTMNQLEYLDLSYNGLYGPVPVPALPKLNYVDLSGNYFRLSLRLGLFSQSKAPTLKLANCQRISGPIPADFASLNFVEIDLSGNQFAGDASILFGASKQTQKINLSGNQFSFDFGKVKFPQGLQELDISRNKIYGKIPSDITTLKNLRSLNVSNNNLCGVIPTGGVAAQFGRLSYFHNKCLCGAPLHHC